MSTPSPEFDVDYCDDNPSFVEDGEDYEQKCRLCLRDNVALIPVHNSENLDGIVTAVALKIDILTTVKVAPTDKICTECRLNVKRFYKFRVMCLRSDSKIRRAAMKRDVSISHFGPSQPIRSYKRQRRGSNDTYDCQSNSINDSLTITPVSQNENGNATSMANDRKSSSGLTISAVPPKRETEKNENGPCWERQMGNGVKSAIDLEPPSTNDITSTQVEPAEETENLEVSVDPFMLMGDDTTDTDQPALPNQPLNVRGQLIYPVFGNHTDLPPLIPGPHRPGPISGKSSQDRERALELIKQMTNERRNKPPGLDGSFLDKPFKCNVCPESFSYYKSFIKHKQRHSGEFQPLRCEFCPDVFQTSRQLQNHLKYHNVEKAFPCNQCERSFPTKERLNSHYTIHTGNKPYVCEICNKSFAYKSSYGLHIRKQHGEQPLKSQSFKCDKCHQEFDIFVDFKNHLRSHEGEKPFTCNVCNKAFGSKSILNVHSRIHNGIKPYRCEKCGQAFTQKQSLDYHMRRHNEENPFKCEICGVTFQRRHFLEKHKENQHGVMSLGSDNLNRDDSLGDLVGHEELEGNQSGDEDDDEDSDPLKLEIDETSIKFELNDDQDDCSIEAE